MKVCGRGWGLSHFQGTGLIPRGQQTFCGDVVHRHAATYTTSNAGQSTTVLSMRFFDCEQSQRSKAWYAYFEVLRCLSTRLASQAG